MFLYMGDHLETFSQHGTNGKSSGRRNAASYHATEQQAPADLLSDDDYKAYIELMPEWCGEYEVDIWAYGLMPNHITWWQYLRKRRT
jgi:hypothetical protein